MPSWAAIATRDDDEFDDDPSEFDALARAITKQTQRPKTIRLTLPQWMAAFETYALACDVTGHSQYGTLKTHQCTCLRVIEQEKNKFPVAIGIEYDRIVRQNWARKVELNVPDFDMKNEASIIQPELLAKAAQSLQEKTAVCTFCYQPGHRAEHCYARPAANQKGKKGKGKGKGKGKNGKGKGKTDDDNESKVLRRPMKSWGSRFIGKPHRD